MYVSCLLIVHPFVVRSLSTCFMFVINSLSPNCHLIVHWLNPLLVNCLLIDCSFVVHWLSLFVNSWTTVCQLVADSVLVHCMWVVLIADGTPNYLSDIENLHTSSLNFVTLSFNFPWMIRNTTDICLNKVHHHFVLSEPSYD